MTAARRVEDGDEPGVTSSAAPDAGEAVDVGEAVDAGDGCGGGPGNGAATRPAPETAQREDPGATAEPRRGAAAHLVAAVREFVTVAAIAIVLSFLVKTFLVQPFYIPSESMEDTLVKGDRVIVSKLTPAPFALERGDIVVFADPGGWLPPAASENHGTIGNAVRSALTFVGLLPNSSEGHLIKRVIGLPGDKVACCDTQGHLTVNGTSLSESYIKPGENPSDIDFEVTVPAGRVWVMGDNRGHSSDSRLHDPSGTGSEGSIDEKLVVGRAVATIWPLNRITWLSNHSDTFASVPARPTG